MKGFLPKIETCLLLLNFYSLIKTGQERFSLKIPYSQYSANGNTFILIDNSKGPYDYLKEQTKNLAFLCHSSKGVGGDGIIFVENSDKASIKMMYFNADGKEVSMCGNGVRSTAHYFYHQKEKQETIFVETSKAIYRTYCQGEHISIEMTDISHKNALDISHLFKGENSFYVEVGVPHCVFLVDEIKDIFINIHAPKIRRDALFKEGTNVNFVQRLSLENNIFAVRTFERGVERETRSCCTGITASALALAHWLGIEGKCFFHTPGGVINLSLGNPICLSGIVHECSRGKISIPPD